MMNKNTIKFDTELKLTKI